MKHAWGDASAAGKRRPFKAVALGAAAALFVPLLGSAGLTPNASANPTIQTPGFPQQVPTSPNLVFEETFDSGTANGVAVHGATSPLPVPVTSYVNTAGQNYSASASWLPTFLGCNGWILNSTTSIPANNATTGDSGCSGTGGRYGAKYGTAGDTSHTAWWFLTQMAYALGTQEQGAGDLPDGVQPATNNVISSQTNAGKNQTDTMQFATASDAVPAIAGHYYEVSAYFAAAHCSQWEPAGTTWNDPSEELSLIVNGKQVVLDSGLNQCKTGTQQVGQDGVTPIMVQKFTSEPMLLEGAQTLGLRLDNLQPNYTGNDVAFDNPEIIDVTPQLDKTFGTATDKITTVTAGQPIPLTFTITNSSELGQKDGWYFTDQLDPNLTMVPNSSATPWSNDCVDPTPYADPTNPFNATTSKPVYASSPSGGVVPDLPGPDNVLTVTGSLAANASYCTVTVWVESNVDRGSTDPIVNGANQISPTGLFPPSDDEAQLEVDPPVLQLNKVVSSVRTPDGVDENGLPVIGSDRVDGVQAGDTVTYSITASNPGYVPVSNVTVADGSDSTAGTEFTGVGQLSDVSNCLYDNQSTDPVENGQILLAATGSASHNSVTCQATYVIQQKDVDNYAAGITTAIDKFVGVENIAVANGYDPTGVSTDIPDVTSNFAYANLTFDATSAISIEKTASPTAVTNIGDQITYTFKVTNGGRTTLENISIDDSDFSGSGALGSITCTYDSGNPVNQGEVPNSASFTLGPGEVANCTAQYAATAADITGQKDITNTATVTGTDPAGASITGTSDTADVTVQGLSLTKVISSVSRVDADANTVDATQAADNPVTIGTDGSGNSLASGLIAGDTITYTFTMTNTGSGVLNNATISDDNDDVLGTSFNGHAALGSVGNCEVAGAGVDYPVPSLEPGDSATCTATYSIDQTDVDNYAAGVTTGVINTAIATANAAGTSATVNSKTATATALPVETSGLSITKVITGTVLTNGQPGPAPSADGNNVTVTQPNTTVNYQIVATNTGQTTLNVKVWDPPIPGAQNIDNNDNTGTPLDGCLVGTDPKDYGPDPSDILSGYPLTPGQSVVCSASYTVIESDLTGPNMSGGQPLVNTAYVSGVDPAANTVGPFSADATIQVASLVLQKTATNADDSPITNESGISQDQQIVYHFVLTNMGTVQITDASIDDSDFSGAGQLGDLNCTWPGSTGTLDPGQSANCTASYTVLPADVSGPPPNQTPITNSAVATGTDPSGDTVTSDTASATTPLDAQSGLTVEKTVSLDPSTPGSKTDPPPTVTSIGQKVYYTITAKNTGKVTLHNVDLTDNGVTNPALPTPVSPLLVSNCVLYSNDTDTGTPVSDGSITLDPVTLNPNEYVTCTATYVTTSDDMTAGGQLVNSAEATGLDLSNTLVGPAYDTAPVDVAWLTLDKTPSYADGSDASTPLTVGKDVNYSFLVTNRGNVALSGITIDDSGTYDGDSLVGFSGTGQPLDVICPATASDWGTSNTVGTLEPGDSVTCTATYTLTQADVDEGVLNNVADVTGTTPDNLTTTSETSSAQLPFSTTAGLQVAKTVSLDPDTPGTATDVQVTAAGQTATFTITAQNTGGVTLHDVAVTDAGLTTEAGGAAKSVTMGNCYLNDANKTSATPGGPITLQANGTPGDTVTCTASYLITQADIDNNQVLTNTATADGKDPSGAPVVANDPTATITPEQSPSLKIAKTAKPATVSAVGDSVAYSFLVTNTGNVTMTGVAVDDTMLANAGVAVVCPDTTLVPIGSESGTAVSSTTCTATYSVTQDDIDAGTIANTATASGLAPNATEQTTSDPDTATVSAQQKSELTVTKAADKASVTVSGDVITYTITAQNTGNVTIHDVTVSDAGVTNGAKGNAGPLTVDGCTLNDADSTSVDNDGTIVLQAAGTTGGGDIVSCTATYKVTQADIDAGGQLTNSASADGTDAKGIDVPSNDASAPVGVAPTSGLTLVKSSDSAPAKVGDTIDYSLLVTNSGGTTINGLYVADTNFTGTGTAPVISCPVDTLGPGVSTTCDASYVVTQPDVDAGVVSNTAEAHGTDVNGLVDSEPATKDVAIPASPTLELTKTHDALTGTQKAGDVVTYRFAVENSGNVTLTGVGVTDPLTGLSDVTCTDWPGDVGTLAPTQTVDCSATYTLTQDDIDAGHVDNTATATGTPPAGTDVHDSSSDTVTLAAAPGLAISKTADKTSVSTPGTVITYTITTTNTGNVTLNPVTVSDAGVINGTGTNIPVPLTVGGCTLNDTAATPAHNGSITLNAAGTLGGGDVVTCTATYTVTQADIDAGGNLANSATAIGTTPTGGGVSPKELASVDVPVEQSPSISLTKTATPATVTGAGDPVEYKYVVTNTGNVSVSNIGLDESGTPTAPAADGTGGVVGFTGSNLLGAISCSPVALGGTLVPSASADNSTTFSSTICTASYTVSQTDVDAGGLLNVAQASSTAPDGMTSVPSNLSAATVVITPNPVLTLVKSASIVGDHPSEEPYAGDQVTYSYTVTNDGNVTMSNVGIDDAGAWTNDQTVGFSGSSPMPSITCPNDPSLWGTSQTVGVLAPGDTIECTSAPYAITQKDMDAGTLDNTAKAHGTAPGTDALTYSNADSISIPQAPAPHLTLTKTALVDGTATSTLPDADGVVTYEFKVINDGNVTMSNVDIIDSTDDTLGTSFSGTGGVPTINSCTYGGSVTTSADPTNMTLAPGDWVTCTATDYTVTQADVDTGSVVNTAIAQGTAPKDTTPTNSNTSTVTLTNTPAPSLTVDKTVASVTLTDTSASGHAATGTGTNAATITDAQAGDQATFQFVVTNTGNVTLSDVNVNDAWTTGNVGAGAPATVATCKYGDTNTVNTGVATDPTAMALAPGETATCTSTAYTLTQADVDNGSIGDTATATGQSPKGNQVTATNTATVSSVQAPHLTIMKSAAPSTVSGNSAAGTSIQFGFALINDGNVTLSNVAVNDPTDTFTGTGTLGPIGNCILKSDGSDVAYPVPSLAPGVEVDCTATYTLTQTDVDAAKVTNEATVSGTAPGASTQTTSTPDDAEVDITPNPSLTVAKQASPTTVTAAGQTVTYTITATNTGNVTLTDVSVTDAGVTNAAAGATAQDVTMGDCYVYSDSSNTTANGSITLAPGDVATCTATYVTSQADIDAGGQLNNSASSTGSDPSNNPVSSGTASAPVDVKPAPGTLDLTKIADQSSQLVVGEEVNYSFMVTNAGDVTINDIAIDDSSFNGAPALSAVTCPVATLAPGEQTTCTTATYTVTQADVNRGNLSNMATATGTDSQGNDVTSNDSSWQIPQPADGVLQVTKMADRQTVSTDGDVIRYTITAVNTGNVTLTDVNVVDAGVTNAAPNATPMPVEFGDCTVDGTTVTNGTFSLDPHQVATCIATYTATQPDIDAGGQLTNSASAYGDEPDHTPVTSNTVQVPVTVTQTPGLTVAKTASPAVATTANQTITYTITATNAGNVTLTGVDVTDAGVTNATSGAEPQPVDITGCTTPSGAATNGSITLAPGDAATCTATYSTSQADIDAGGQLNNSASAAGIDPSNGSVSSDTATAPVDITQAPHLTLTKTAQETSVTAAGDVVHYTITTKNDGDVTVSGITVQDAGVTNASGTTSPVTVGTCTVGGTTVTNGKISLAPGRSVVCDATYTASQDDIDAGDQLKNLAESVGSGPTGQVVHSNIAPQTIDVTPTTGLQVTKAPDSQTMTAANQVASFTITATNTGTSTLQSVKVADTGLSNYSGPLTVSNCKIGPLSANNLTGFDLPPNATATCQAFYTMTQADIDAGTALTNTASASGTGPGNDSVIATPATAEVDITQTPKLAVLKTADDSNTLTAGESVDYSFLVTNTGNVTISNIAIDETTFTGTDPMPAITCPVAPLAPGDHTTCTTVAAYVLTQDDVNSGELTNTASATGTSPSNNNPSTPDVTSGTSTWDIPQPPAATVAITEVPSPASGLRAGDSLIFTVTATNTGNVPLDNVTLANVSDGWTGAGAMPDINPASIMLYLGGVGPGQPVINGSFSMQPGDVVAYQTMPYTVLQTDVDNQTPISNQASVTGTPPASTKLAAVSADTTVPAMPVAAQAHVTITQSVSQDSGLQAGNQITFTSTATNDGTVTLNNVFIENDPAAWTGSGPMPKIVSYMVDGQPVVNGQFSLAPGQSVVIVTEPYSVTQQDVNAGQPLSNNSIVTGTPPANLNLALVTASASAHATMIAPTTPSYVVQTGAVPAAEEFWLLAAALLAVAGIVIGIIAWRRRHRDV